MLETTQELSLTEQLEETANALMAVENLQAEVNQTEHAIKVMIEQQFPGYEDLKYRLAGAKSDYAKQVFEVKQRAIQDNESELTRLTRGALVMKLAKRVTHFDKKEAIRFAKQIGRIELLKLDALQSTWQRAVDNGDVFPAEIIVVEDVLEASIFEENLKSFATGQ